MYRESRCNNELTFGRSRRLDERVTLNQVTNAKRSFCCNRKIIMQSSLGSNKVKVHHVVSISRLGA